MSGVLRRGRLGGGIGAVAGLLFSTFTGPPLALADYILTFAMMILMFFTFFFVLKPACSRTMRGGDRPTFLLLLFSSLLYFAYYVLAFLVYTLGPWEMNYWQSPFWYWCFSFIATLLYNFAFTALLCALLIANLRDFDPVPDQAELYNVSVPPDWRSVVAVGSWLSLIGILYFIINLVQILPSAYVWNFSKIKSFESGGEALLLLWDSSRLIAIAWLWFCCWKRHNVSLPGSNYHKVSVCFVSPLLLLASIGILGIDAEVWKLFIHNESTLPLNTAFNLAYRLAQTAPEWLSLLILLCVGRRLAKARGDDKGIFQYRGRS